MATPGVPGPGRSEVVTVAETGSTQTDLVGLVQDADAWPHLSGLRALRQTAGRGRGGRTWHTDELRALTVSLVLRPQLPRERWTWLPLLTGLAVARAIGEPARLKWPNDVLLPAPDGREAPGWGPWRKVAGVLAQVVADGGAPAGRPAACVVGVGVNLAGPVPVPWATTLREVGLPDGGDELLERVRAGLASLLASDPHDWRSAVERVCATVGSAVEISLPDGTAVTGAATGLDEHGALVVRDGAGAERAVLAGDVAHCRAAPSRDR